METPYINIGTEKSCLFVHMSLHMIKHLEMYPLLFYAVEEAMKCAEMEYFAAGIIIFSELSCKIFNVKKPHSRNTVAHEPYKYRPQKTSYDNILKKFEDAAKRKYEEEFFNRKKDQKNYHEQIRQRWNELQSKLRGNSQ